LIPTSPRLGGHLRYLYGIEVSFDLISAVTDPVLELGDRQYGVRLSDLAEENEINSPLARYAVPVDASTEPAS
jgi:hypothetical protein